MQRRKVSVLCAAIAGAMLLAAAPARASSDFDSVSLFGSSISIGSIDSNNRDRIDDQEGPRSLSFKFASLYNRIRETAARLAEFTHLDSSTKNTLGLNISFQSLEDTDNDARLDSETTRLLLPELDESPTEGFSLRLDFSDDHAPLVDPSPRKPSDPLKDKIWLSLGARYNHSERLSVDIGYEHLWVNETTFGSRGGVGNDIMGDYRSEMDLIGARLRWAFD